MHPTAFQCEDVFDHAWSWLHRLAARLAQSALFEPIQGVDHLLTGHEMVTVVPKGRHQGHPSWSWKFALQRLIIGFPIHDHCRDHTSPIARFQPQACRCMGAGTPGLESTQYTGAVRYHATRPRPIHPSDTGACAPRRLLLHATPSLRDDAWRVVLGMPDGSSRLLHHLLAAAELIERGWRNAMQDVSGSGSALCADVFSTCSPLADGYRRSPSAVALVWGTVSLDTT